RRSRDRRCADAQRPRDDSRTAHVRAPRRRAAGHSCRRRRRAAARHREDHPGMSKPTIAFFGSSLVSAYWNGAATYYRGIIRALHARGYRVTFYEPDAYDRQAHRDIPDPDWARVVVYPAT